MNRESFSTRLKELRLLRGFSASELGEVIGAKEHKIYSWERRVVGEPKASDLDALCDALETTKDYLVRGEGPRDAPKSEGLRNSLLDFVKSAGDPDLEKVQAFVDGMKAEAKSPAG